MDNVVIIVTFNGMPWLKQCLDSCAKYSVIVVDNASTDQTVSFIKSNYPEVILIAQTTNLGFGQANNIGIRYALDHGAEHVFLLNQDAYLTGSVIEDLVAFQSKNPEYGILSPIHITGDRKKMDRRFSKYLLKEYTGQFYSDFVLGNTIAAIYEVPFVNAAAWLVSRKCLETVGGFDPLFFHYGEDDNYCQRVIYHGLKIGVLPNVYIVHDRIDRKSGKPSLFSLEYFKYVDRNYKSNYANINTNFNLNKPIVKLRKQIIKSLLKLDFKKAVGYQKELSILLKNKPLIEKSMAINRTKGMHYL